MDKFNRNDIAILTEAARRGSLGIFSQKFSAAARQRLIKAGYIFEDGISFRVGMYRSTLRITPEGREAFEKYIDNEKKT